MPTINAAAKPTFSLGYSNHRYCIWIVPIVRAVFEFNAIHETFRFGFLSSQRESDRICFPVMNPDHTFCQCSLYPLAIGLMPLLTVTHLLIPVRSP